MKIQPSKSHYEQVISGPWETWNKERDIEVRIEWVEPSILLLTFQGSTSKTDWLINFDFFIKPYKRMDQVWFAHRGYIKSYKSIRDRVLEEAEKAEKVYVYGFSQGAGYAVLTHEDLKFHGVAVETVAYAPPRVFWFLFLKRIADRFEDLTIVINRGDIVTMVPPWIMGFRHVGLKKLVGSSLSWIPRIKNHFPEEYKKSLTSN